MKIHSGVFASHPEGAGRLASKFFSGEELELVDGEVMDIDERAFREGIITARLYGVMRIPSAPPSLFKPPKRGAVKRPSGRFFWALLNELWKRWRTTPRHILYYRFGQFS